MHAACDVMHTPCMQGACLRHRTRTNTSSSTTPTHTLAHVCARTYAGMHSDTLRTRTRTGQLIMTFWCQHDDCLVSTQSFTTLEDLDAHDLDAHLHFCSVKVIFLLEGGKHIEVTLAVRDTLARANKCLQYVRHASPLLFSSLACTGLGHTFWHMPRQRTLVRPWVCRHRFSIQRC
jgi:hypothetical protein